MTGAARTSYDVAGNMTSRTIAGQATQSLVWDESSRLESITQGASTFGDHLGSASTVRTAAGANVRQRYLPFGRVRGAVSLPTEYGFTGQRLDPSGLMDYNARQYDPVLGRFTSPDTIIPDVADPQSFNRYSYVNNNPVNFTDPSGHCASPTTPSGSQAIGWETTGCPFSEIDVPVILIDSLRRGSSAVSSAVQATLVTDRAMLEQALEARHIRVDDVRSSMRAGGRVGGVTTVAFVVVDGLLVRLDAADLRAAVLAGGGTDQLAGEAAEYFKYRGYARVVGTAAGSGGGAALAVAAACGSSGPLCPWIAGFSGAVAGGWATDKAVTTIYDLAFGEPLITGLVKLYEEGGAEAVGSHLAGQPKRGGGGGRANNVM